ncbi:receptor-like protein EIX1 [Rosa chinensis]|uniref:receptor-like protein EIX1 n=1 Tax=Rosa chinensis TaxID=74649 RepID=UPI001AD8C54E|nr:receptor-like protein EIX1 [Rosa chinensis]
MSARSSIHSGSVLARLLWLVIISSAATCCCCSSAAGNISTSNDVNVRCMAREKHALLQFKQGLVDDSNDLAPWEIMEDCCEWTGIACDFQTGHVIMLDLSNTHYFSLRGEIGPSLLELPYLYYLDLGSNSFNGTIPKFLGSLSRLKVLKLGYNRFSGFIPPQLGNLSNLHTLDLSWNYVTSDNLKWVSRLSSLRYLNMSALNFSSAVNWAQSISQLPSLILLQLGSCDLPDVDTASLSFINSSTSLQVFDLSFNFLISSSVFYWIGSVSKNPVSIDLSNSRIKGPIPDAFTNMDSLLSLDLSSNQLEGGIPKSFRSLCRLEKLYLLSNNFSDRLEQSIGNLSCAQNTLKSLNLSDNLWWGPFPDDLTRCYRSFIVIIDRSFR